MSPSSSRPADRRSSGNPATQAKIDQTVKQQREQQKQEKLAQYRRELARRRRSRVLWWVVSAVVVAVVAGIVIASFVFAPQPDPVATYTPGSSGDEVAGVQTFDNATTHVEGTVQYPQDPPAGGPHNPAWLNCGIYTEPQQNELAVHSMEHGAVWVTYDPALPQDQLDTLRGQLPSTYVILSPYPGLDSPVVLSAWDAQLRVDSVTDPGIPAFFEEFWRSQNAPEPNALCSGAIDGPGKVS